MRLETKIEGLKELEQALKELPAHLVSHAGGPVKLALKAAAQPVLESQQAKAMIHSKTGNLMDSLRVMRHPNPKYLNELFGVGVRRLGKRPAKGAPQDTGLPWYADIVEYGGRGKTGPLKGFIRESLEKNRKKSALIYRKHLATSIERIARKVGNENARKVAAKVKKL